MGMDSFYLRSKLNEMDFGTFHILFKRRGSVMTLKTPRRRISPRARRRYRAIKHFFRKALGTSTSQPEINNTNSCISDNVTDLKHKIIGLEQQLSEVSKHCRDIIHLESSSRGVSQVSVSETRGHGPHESSIKQGPIETKLLYKTSESHYRTTDESDYVSRHHIQPNVGQNLRANDCRTPSTKSSKKKKSKVNSTVKDHGNLNCSKKKTQSMPSVNSSTSFHSISDFYPVRHANPGIAYVEKDKKRDRVEKQHLSRRPSKMYNEHMQKNYETFERYYNKHNGNHKMKHSADALDQDFIADIIKRQYKPVKMFDRRASDFSQVSEPVCRDYDFHIKEDIQENSELCSCCYGRCLTPTVTRRGRHTDHSETRSICDARLYRSTRMPRVKQRRVHPHSYNDSELYDLVPVKEYPSPKSKRKVFQECSPYSCQKEVPPSPKTHRPRLNLKAQYYTASEDHIDFLRNPKRIPHKLYQKYHEISEVYDSEETEMLPQTPRQFVNRLPTQRPEKVDKHQQIQDDNLTALSSVQYNTSMYEHKNTVDTPLDKTLESDKSDDKTDRALCEIKDILQSFLQEIKKEASSQSAKSDLGKIGSNISRAEAVTSNPTQATQVSSGVTPDSGHSFNNYSVPQCPVPPSNPFMPTFTNPCCYPMLPMYPMNCMQNGYVVPTPSYTCGNCTNKLDETVNKSTSGNAVNDNICSETDELIKEIYKFVAQSPTFSKKEDYLSDSVSKRVEKNQHRLTSRSAGGSTQLCRHDAKVGTPNIRSYSKSCEAIGSRLMSEYYSSTNASYSDTGLETSIATKSTSETEISSNMSTIEKDKAAKGKITNMLWSLFKKKRDVIEEEDEVESLLDAEPTRRIPPNPPFRQHLTSYSMYEQHPYQPPPQPPPPAPATHRPREYSPDRAPPYNPGLSEYHMPQVPEAMYHPCPSYYPAQSPSAPPFANYDYHQPPYPPHSQSQSPYSPHSQSQPPLCLKEIEVKSIGCQSDRKLSFFKKMTMKTNKPDGLENQTQRNFSTQTTLPAQNKPGLFNWKQSQKFPKFPKFEDPIAYGYKAQKKLAEGDLKMRKAMLKKMFRKKNPFSPNNLIIRTLLGKDKSSWGDAPTMARPRMFL